MHKRQMKVLAVLCAPLFAGGCAFLKPSPASVAMAPLTWKPGSPTSDASYQVGRAYETNLDYQRAIDSYRKAIKENPNNAEAHNALGVIYASQGRNNLAISELSLAASLAPKSVHIQNNLGYAYLLAGRNADAMGALTIASGIEPGNERVRENLRNAQARVTVERPPAEVIAAKVIAESRAPAAPPAPAPAPAPDPDMPTLVSVAPNIFELRQHLPRIARPAVAAAPAVVPSPVAAPLRTVKLEISNGNGVTGFAKRTSTQLRDKGYVITRLTNQVPYTQEVTEIQYRRGQETAARRLTELFSVRAQIVESKSLSETVGVRLVLGRDLMQGPVFTEATQKHLGKAGEEAPPAPRG